MKRVFFGLIICLSLFIAQSCDNDNTNKESKALTDSDVPATVKAAFSAKYSTATDVKWEDASQNNVQTYKAKFLLNGKKMKAEFDGTGTFVKEEEDN